MGDADGGSPGDWASLQYKRNKYDDKEKPVHLDEENLNRLSAPKIVHPKFIPDKPSVYWLDYLVDPTPHQIVNPKELDSYYQQFMTPRLERLSQPKINASDTSLRPSKAMSSCGVPMSALQYIPSDRIKQLAEPRTGLRIQRQKKSYSTPRRQRQPVKSKAQRRVKSRSLY